MEEKKLNCSVAIDTQYCRKILNKIKVRPYRDKRYKKGFVMRGFDSKTGQFNWGRGVSYPDPETKEYYDGRKIKRRKKKNEEKRY